jgi:hypothetical protein
MGRFFQDMYTRWPDLYVVHHERATLCLGSSRKLLLLSSDADSHRHKNKAFPLFLLYYHQHTFFCYRQSLSL